MIYQVASCTAMYLKVFFGMISFYFKIICPEFDRFGEETRKLKTYEELAPETL